MLKKLLLLMVLIPPAEILLLIQAEKLFGFGLTILLLLIAGLIGVAIVRSQGTVVYYRLRRELAQGQAPGLTLLDGFLLLLGGVLLIIPGFLTDLAGLLLLVPLVRRSAQNLLLFWLWRAVERGNIRFFTRR